MYGVRPKESGVSLRQEKIKGWHTWDLSNSIKSLRRICYEIAVGLSWLLDFPSIKNNTKYAQVFEPRQGFLLWGVDHNTRQ